jgi:GTPase SAR1 family protein
MLTKKNEFNVVILGLSGCGKTALLEFIKEIYLKQTPLPMNKLLPTVGLNIAKGNSKYGECRILTVPNSDFSTSDIELLGHWRNADVETNMGEVLQRSKCCCLCH